MTTLDTLMLVKTADPVAVRRLQPAVPRDLETVCLKCLQKEPAKRYATAEALADDLRRFLDGRPIVARPVGTLERAGKWVRRRPTEAGLLAAVLLVAALGFALVTWKWREADVRADSESSAKTDALTARRQVERLSIGLFLDRGVALCEQGSVDRGLLWLAHGLGEAVRIEDPDLERVARTNLASWRGHFVSRRASLPHKDWVYAATFSRDGKSVATAGAADQTARVWDAATGRPMCPPLLHDQPVWTVALHPDGETLATGSCPQRSEGSPAVTLWQVRGGEPNQLIQLPLTSPVKSVAFNKDGSALLAVCPLEVRLWGKGVDGQWEERPLPHPGPVHTAAFSTDGLTVATGGKDRTVRFWDTSSGKSQERESLTCPWPVGLVAYCPFDRTLATVGRITVPGNGAGVLGPEVQLWDVARGERRGPLLKHRGEVRGLAFSPDGRTLAVAGAVWDAVLGGEVRRWQTATGRPVGPPLAHPLPVWSVAFNRTGRVLVTGCEDGRPRFFAADSGLLIGGPAYPPGGTVAAAALTWRLPRTAGRSWSGFTAGSPACGTWRPGSPWVAR